MDALSDELSVQKVYQQDLKGLKLGEKLRSSTVVKNDLNMVGQPKLPIRRSMSKQLGKKTYKKPMSISMIEEEDTIEILSNYDSDLIYKLERRRAMRRKKYNTVAMRARDFLD